MIIKDIKLSSKRGNYNKVTSYTINIGSAEARECGFVDSDGNKIPIEKIVDTENNKIIIRVKAD